MTKYTRLMNMKNNFIKAASKAKSNFMIALWIYRADVVQKEIDELTLKEAMEDK